MRTMKKLLAVTLSLAMGIGLLTACAQTGDTKATTEAGQTKGASETDATDATDATKAPSQGTDTTADWPQMSAAEMAVIMGNGIDLGNTMEATSASIGKEAGSSSYETAWGAPITTAEMIQGMKDAGFDTIRIPVAWTNTMDIVNDDYTINDDYLARVKEIVDYAYAADMYVILNDHWDGGWWGMFGSATETTVEKAWKVYEEIWTQVGNYFIDYDYHLIFESGNEEIGNRLNDVDTQYPTLTADSGTLDENAWYEMANAINQKFVDIIRGLGANNAQRYLLIAGANTNIPNVLDSRFAMPTDTATDKLFLSVHFYDPSNYTGAAGSASVSTWGLKTEVEAMNETLKKLSVFTEKGIPVIIGEYGVLYNQRPSSEADLREGHATYIKNFLDNCDIYGYVPVLWDCNSIFNRSTCKIDIASIAEIYKAYSYAEQSKLTADEVKANAEKDMEDILANATDYSIADGTAWIMYSSSDWAVSYAVGDDHPAGGTDGIVSVEEVVTGEGEYTVSLDFTGTSAGSANSFVFTALGILNGELLYPGYIIDITDVSINGTSVDSSLYAKTYTTSDDKTCTRVNLYNGWVNSVPDEARTLSGSLDEAIPSGILDPEAYTAVETISVTFKYVAPQ